MEMKRKATFEWNQQEEEKLGSIGSVTKEDTRRIVDQEDYGSVKKPMNRILSNFMPEIFAVDRFKIGGSPTTTSTTRLPGATQVPGFREERSQFRGWEGHHWEEEDRTRDGEGRARDRQVRRGCARDFGRGATRITREDAKGMS